MNKLFSPVFVLLLALPFPGAQQKPINASGQLPEGAWSRQSKDDREILLFVDNYFVFTSYSEQLRSFHFTWGGPYTLDGNYLVVQTEFNSTKRDEVGKARKIPIQMSGQNLSLSIDGETLSWSQLDNGKSALAGVWHISGRMADGKISEMPLRVRRTLKILSGSRFQWTAINIETGEFFGTGGGSYRFDNGKYTESIEFFSRDSSRVGSSLSFDGKIIDGAWHHSGLSSRGEKIYEIWNRLK